MLIAPASGLGPQSRPMRARSRGCVKSPGDRTTFYGFRCATATHFDTNTIGVQTTGGSCSQEESSVASLSGTPEESSRSPLAVSKSDWLRSARAARAREQELPSRSTCRTTTLRGRLYAHGKLPSVSPPTGARSAEAAALLVCRRRRLCAPVQSHDWNKRWEGGIPAAGLSRRAAGDVHRSMCHR